LLQNLDPDLPVVRHGYEGGYSDATNARTVELVSDYNDPEEWWYGPHEDLKYLQQLEQKLDPNRVFKAVLVY